MSNVLMLYGPIQLLGKFIIFNVSVAVHEYANSTSAHDTVLEHRFSLDLAH